jgi:uncharacterized protein YjbI with pentapeptide repeats
MNISGASIPALNLSGANLSRTNLSYANLEGANLSGANLRYAFLTRTELTKADLTHADLTGAYLAGAYLADANFGGVTLAYTDLTNADLGSLCEASPPLVHEGPSTIDHRSIVRSVGSPRLREFLVRAGMLEIFAEYMIDCAKSVSWSAFQMMRSSFISYGAPDEAFAKKINDALCRNGVATFLFSEHAKPGEKLHRMMRRAVNAHDRVVLICSKASLIRKGVMNEIEETLAREAREGGETYLIPIRLDDYVFTGWKPKREDIAQAIRDRVVADFEGADNDEAKFTRELGKLLKVLTKPRPAGAHDLSEF